MHSVAIPCVLALFALLTVESPALAQTVADTAARADTAVARSGADTGRGVPADTGRGAPEDMGRGAPADTGASRTNPAAPPTPQAPTAPPAQAAAPTPPVDSALKAACQGAQAGTRAPGLLLVTFSDSLTGKQRLAVARSVGGTLAGAAATGGNYVQVPADPAAARMAADSLIRTLGVLQVTERSCPALGPSGR
jgi:hypothetical protein